MSKPNLAAMMSGARQARHILKKYGLQDIPVAMDVNMITIGTFDVPKECEKELQALGFMVMKIELSLGGKTDV